MKSKNLKQCNDLWDLDAIRFKRIGLKRYYFGEDKKISEALFKT